MLRGRLGEVRQVFSRCECDVRGPVLARAFPAVLAGFPPTRVGYMSAPVSSKQRVPLRVVWCTGRDHTPSAWPVWGARWPRCLGRISADMAAVYEPVGAVETDPRRPLSGRLGQECGRYRTRYFPPTQAGYMSAAGPGSCEGSFPGGATIRWSVRGDLEGDQVRIEADSLSRPCGRSVRFPFGIFARVSVAGSREFGRLRCRI